MSSWHTRANSVPRFSSAQCCLTSAETIKLLVTERPGRPPRLLRGSWARTCSGACNLYSANTQRGNPHHSVVTYFIPHANMGNSFSQMKVLTLLKQNKTIKQKTKQKTGRGSGKLWRWMNRKKYKLGQEINAMGESRMAIIILTHSQLPTQNIRQIWFLSRREP